MSCYPLKGMDDFPVSEPVAQFPGLQEMLRVAGLPEKGLFQSEGFIYENASRFQRFSHAGNEWPEEIAEYQKSAEGKVMERVFALLFKVNLPKCCCEITLLKGLFSLAEGIP